MEKKSYIKIDLIDLKIIWTINKKNNLIKQNYDEFFTCYHLLYPYYLTLIG